MCKDNLSYEHKKKRNHAVVRFRFFIANAKKEHDVFCSSLMFNLSSKSMPTINKYRLTGHKARILTC